MTTETSPPTVSLSEAARILGDDRPHAGRRLRRRLQALQRATGVQLLVPAREGSRRPTYRVSMAMLRLTCPDLFRQRQRDEFAQVGRAVAQQLADITDRVDELAANVAALAESARRRLR